MVIGFVVVKWGWHAGFGLAGIAMLLGLVVYIWGQKYLTHVGNLEQKVNEVDESSYGRLLEIFLNLKLNWYLRLYFLLYPYLDGII
jgi:POT family proton-dependent oligopeptide transporter